MRIHPLLAVVVLLLGGSQALFAQETSQADFQKFVGQFSGVWLGQTTAAGDMLWNSEKQEWAVNAGQSLPAYVKATPTMNGHALQVYVRTADAAHQDLVFFDPSESRIRLISINHQGTLHDEDISLKDGVWRFSGNRINPDGTTKDLEATLEFAADGNSFTFIDSDTGQAPQSWQRINNIESPPAGSEIFRDFAKKFSGMWVREAVRATNWRGAMQAKGEKGFDCHQWHLIMDGHALERTRFSGRVSFNDTFYFDPETGRIVVSSISSLGGFATGVVKQMGDETWVLNLNGGAMSDGQTCAGSVTWEFSDDGKVLRETGQLSLDGKMLDPIDAMLYRVNDQK